MWTTNLSYRLPTLQRRSDNWLVTNVKRFCIPTCSKNYFYFLLVFKTSMASSEFFSRSLFVGWGIKPVSNAKCRSSEIVTLPTIDFMFELCHERQNFDVTSEIFKSVKFDWNFCSSARTINGIDNRCCSQLRTIREIDFKSLFYFPLPVHYNSGEWCRQSQTPSEQGGFLSYYQYQSWMQDRHASLSIFHRLQKLN